MAAIIDDSTTGCSCCTTFAGSVLISVRKRTWTNAKGEEKTAWVADYIDGKGIRCLKTFAKKKDADGFAATAHVQVREGTHVADSVTGAVAGKLWIASAEAAGLERITIDSCRSHLKFAHRAVRRQREAVGPQHSGRARLRGPVG
jgi:hypothetical protein